MRSCSPKILLLSRSTIARLATSADYLSSAREAFMDLAAGRFELPEVGHIPAAAGAFHIKMAAHSNEGPLAVIKLNANFPRNSLAHGLPTIQGFIALLDAECGSVLALMDSIEITARRTAAATALAAHHLARRESSVLGFIGCGMQARYHLDALLDVIAARLVRFSEPRDDAAEMFERRVRERKLEALRVTDARAVARHADIVVTLTPSRQAVLSLADVEPGTLVAGVGADNPSKQELAVDLLCASRVVVDRLAQAATMGDLHHAVRCGAMRPADIHGELADVVAGRIPGRSHDSERFVFDSTGIAALDLAAASMVFERARKSGDNLPTIALDDD